ncbi:nicotinate-nucleotide adenylyltransferase [Wenzhouxiangella sp. XN79A]|uniref:nicotinate-nucleotide adenylyltransferase n=1 Tax=Wenzhouxiangella sp. XN79A TaxID=2724193 RepID=UPI00144A9F17|nr:nicotinate-nucleotide adenylyltransferase [Wenzhouxiangella sp. XN79A]NKI34305.1 nicotinate-nucleotide adenylyltransferase [Wenzhouxiangella sp. XN79A]
MTDHGKRSGDAATHHAIAIFGGTFDPVHYGHLRAAAEVAERLGVSDFRLLPAGQPPHRDSTWAPPRHRMAMLELALAPHADLSVDDREVQRSGPSYMADTLASIREQAGELPVVLCLGQDAANQLDRWHEWTRLIERAHLLVMTRPESEPEYSDEVARVLAGRWVEDPRALMDAPAGRICNVDVTCLAISSTDIRNQLARGRDPRFLLPSTVLAYIRKHGLYRDACGRAASPEA